MEVLKLVINDIDYTSIGSYMDNQDGIGSYIPESEDASDWIDFLMFEDPIIILWSLSYLKEVYEHYGSVAKTVIESQKDNLDGFLKKYYPLGELSDIFIDFNFGAYSAHGDEDFPKIIYENKLVVQEWFEFDNYTFIKSNMYTNFISDLNKTADLIIGSLEKAKTI